MARVGVILSGCGVSDGSEIHEAVLLMLSLDQREAKVRCLGLDEPFTPVNHLTQKAESNTRNALAESARIARGEIDSLAKANLDDFDAFVLPGGFGAAQNLSTYATEGAECSVNADLHKLLTDAHAAGKPLGFACIAPVIAAKVFGHLNPQLTVGRDEETSGNLNAMGADAVPCGARDIVVDERHRIASTPAYMEAANMTELQLGLDKLVAQILDWVEQPGPA